MNRSKFDSPQQRNQVFEKIFYEWKYRIKEESGVIRKLAEKYGLSETTVHIAIDKFLKKEPKTEK